MDPWAASSTSSNNCRTSISVGGEARERKWKAGGQAAYLEPPLIDYPQVIVVVGGAFRNFLEPRF